MPFIRHTRDKRGFETTFVMHAYRSASSQGRPRVLYFFRTAAHLRMGRRPLDEETREALQHTHPDLSFDWYSLGREAQPARDVREERDARPLRRDRERGRERQARQGRPDRPDRPAPPPAQAQVPDPPRVDDSVLGRAVGAGVAARLRERYAALEQRIDRRSRTPDERIRLIEQLQRLNPDEWADEADARTGAASVEAEWDAIAATLPQRRRGRRGGRRFADVAAEAGGAATGLSSEIIGTEGETHAVPEDVAADGADPGAGPDRDGDRLGPGADAPAGDGDLPLDGELRHD